MTEVRPDLPDLLSETKVPMETSGSPLGHNRGLPAAENKAWSAQGGKSEAPQQKYGSAGPGFPPWAKSWDPCSRAPNPGRQS